MLCDGSGRHRILELITDFFMYLVLPFQLHIYLFIKKNVNHSLTLCILMHIYYNNIVLRRKIVWYHLS